MTYLLYKYKSTNYNNIKLMKTLYLYLLTSEKNN